MSNVSRVHSSTEWDGRSGRGLFLGSLLKYGILPYPQAPPSAAQMRGLGLSGRVKTMVRVSSVGGKANG